MGRTLIQLAIAVICNVAAVLIAGITYLLNDSLGSAGVIAGVLVVIGALINPPAHEVRFVLEAIANSTAKQ